jgi:hypothetical protein
MSPVLGRGWLKYVRSRPLPWHAEEKVLEGSFATLLGVTVSERHWRAIAVGDTCLFHVRDGAMLSSFPYTASAEFSASPVLVCTAARSAQSMTDAIRLAEGELRAGDVIVMATDGLAEWLLRSVESARQPWHIFDGGRDALQLLVDEERASRRMRNDDVGCAWLAV